MKTTLMELININSSYAMEHGVTEKDVEKANKLIELIENTRNINKPVPGDVIICQGPKKTYCNGHLERNIGDYSSICTRPYIPFVGILDKDGEDEGIYFTTSGGYWLSEPNPLLFKYSGTRMKTFCAWGHCGACGNGAFNFRAKVNVWELFKEDIY